MTNQEWKELFHWVEKLNCDRIEAQCVIDNEVLEDEVIYVKSVDDYFGYRIGLIIEQDGMIYNNDYVCIATNRTPQQIKAIIKNLLN